jgi:hypothetical protein
VPDPYIHPRQPDYGNFPEGEFFEEKKALLNQAHHNWTYGTLTEKDFLFLHGKATQFWQLFAFTAEYRLELETEIFTRDLEIENLKQQLKEALGN